MRRQSCITIAALVPEPFEDHSHDRDVPGIACEERPTDYELPTQMLLLHHFNKMARQVPAKSCRIRNPRATKTRGCLTNRLKEAIDEPAVLLETDDWRSYQQEAR